MAPKLLVCFHSAIHSVLLLFSAIIFKPIFKKPAARFTFMTEAAKFVSMIEAAKFESFRFVDNLPLIG
jgi:hypothetical protein